MPATSESTDVLEETAEEQHVIPPWVGGVAIVGGLLLVGAGVRRRA